LVLPSKHCAGNPQPEDDSQYATAYLWQRLFEPEAWLKVLGRFLHLEKDTREGFDGIFALRIAS